MLQASLMLFDTGRIRCSTAEAPATFNGGTPITALGLLSLTASDPTGYTSGVGYIAATGSLAADIGGAVASFHQGMPFTAAGRIACDEVGAIDHYLAGIPRTSSGALATAAPE